MYIFLYIAFAIFAVAALAIAIYWINKLKANKASGKIFFAFLLAFIFSLICFFAANHIKFEADKKADLESRFGSISLTESEVDEYANALINGK